MRPGKVFEDPLVRACLALIACLGLVQFDMMFRQTHADTFALVDFTQPRGYTAVNDEDVGSTSRDYVTAFVKGIADPANPMHLDDEGRSTALTALSDMAHSMHQVLWDASVITRIVGKDRVDACLAIANNDLAKNAAYRLEWMDLRDEVSASFGPAATESKTTAFVPVRDDWAPDAAEQARLKHLQAFYDAVDVGSGPDLIDELQNKVLVWGILQQQKKKPMKGPDTEILAHALTDFVQALFNLNTEARMLQQDVSRYGQRAAAIEDHRKIRQGVPQPTLNELRETILQCIHAMQPPGRSPARPDGSRTI